MKTLFFLSSSWRRPYGRSTLKKHRIPTVESLQRQFQVTQASAVIPLFSGMLHTEVPHKNILNFFMGFEFLPTFLTRPFIFALFRCYFSNYLFTTRLIELWSSRIEFTCAVIFRRFRFIPNLLWFICLSLAQVAQVLLSTLPEAFIQASLPWLLRFVGFLFVLLCYSCFESPIKHILGGVYCPLAF